MSAIRTNKQLNWKYISLFLIGLFIGVGIGSLLYKLNSDKIKQLNEDSKPIYISIERFLLWRG